MTGKQTSPRRRKVLKTATSLAGLQAVGQVNATGDGVQFTEVGIKHRFDELPDQAKKAHVHSSKTHVVDRENQDLVIHRTLTPKEEQEVVQDNSSVVWCDGFSGTPVKVMEHDPEPLLVDRLTESLQPLTAVELVNKYKPPMVKVAAEDGGVSISSRRAHEGLSAGDSTTIELQSRKVPVKTRDDSPSEVVTITPVITAVNHGRLSVKRV